MALVMNAHQRTVLEAQQRIFNKLCAAFRRSRQNPGFCLLIDDIRTELNIPQTIFTQALESFTDATGERILLTVEQDGRRYITLGESAKSNLSDWVDTPQPAVGFRSATPGEFTRPTKYGLRYAEVAIKNR